MVKLDYATPGREGSNAAETAEVVGLLTMAVVSGVGIYCVDSAAAALLCGALLVAAGVVLAVLLWRWRRRVHWAARVVGWTVVAGIGLVIGILIVVAIGIAAGMIRV